MADYGYDTEEFTVTVTMPDGKEVVVVGSNDGDGFEWSAATDFGAITLPVHVERTPIRTDVTRVESS